MIGAINTLNDVRNCKQFLKLNAEVYYSYCFNTFKYGIALVIPGLCTWFFSIVTLATTAFKINTYVRKELEDIAEGQLEDFDVDKEREKKEVEASKNKRINKYIDRENM